MLKLSRMLVAGLIIVASNLATPANAELGYGDGQARQLSSQGSALLLEGLAHVRNMYAAMDRQDTKKAIEEKQSALKKISDALSKYVSSRQYVSQATVKFDTEKSAPEDKELVSLFIFKMKNLGVSPFPPKSKVVDMIVNLIGSLQEEIAKFNPDDLLKKPDEVRRTYVRVQKIDRELTAMAYAIDRG